MKRFAALLLTLLLIASVSPIAAASLLPDNPEGSTVSKIAAGDMMETNNGTVVENNGTVDKNNHAVNENNGTVNGNYGSVSTNFKNGIVAMNAGDSSVDQNYGSVGENNGTIIRNYSSGTVEENNSNMAFNYGTVNTNCGSVATNMSNGTITVNAESGTVEENDGTVTENVGTVEKNDGIVETNRGEVVMGSSGTVKANYGAVTKGRLLADGTIGYGSDAVVGVNYASDANRSRQMLEQTINPDTDPYSVLSYTEVFSSLPGNKRFYAWRSSDGKTYQPGDAYSEIAGLDLTAILRVIYTPVCAANADGSAAVTDGRAVDLLKVLVDGTPVAADCYTAENAGYNASAFTFTEAFLATLSSGSHEVTLCFANGSCSFTFTK